MHAPAFPLRSTLAAAGLRPLYKSVTRAICPNWCITRSLKLNTAVMAAGPPAPKDGETYYFAYGSMCNPVSLRRRTILPSYSTPAKLSGYRLAFDLNNGMANIVPDPSSSLQGILHLVTDDMFQKLSEIEAVYDVITVPCQPYDDSLPLVPAKAFIVPEGKLPPPKNGHVELPTERYITIISRGLQHYGADPAWIDYIQKQPCTPSRQPHEYRRLEVAAEADPLPEWTLEQLAERKGKSPVVYAIGRKVLQVDTSTNPDSPMVTILERLMAGTQACYMMVMNLYEPRLPEIQGPEDMTEEHHAWAEDMAADMGEKQGFKVTQIAWLHLPQAKSNPPAATATAPAGAGL